MITLDQAALMVIEDYAAHHTDSDVEAAKSELKALYDEGSGEFEKEFDESAFVMGKSSWERNPDYHEALRDEVEALIGVPGYSNQIKGESAMKLTRNTLRQLIKEELSRLNENDPPGYSKDHPAFSGDKVSAGELGHRDVFDGMPQKTEEELIALGYTNEWDYDAYVDGYEQGIHDKGFKS